MFECLEEYCRGKLTPIISKMIYIVEMASQKYTTALEFVSQVKDDLEKISATIKQTGSEVSAEIRKDCSEHDKGAKLFQSAPEKSAPVASTSDAGAKRGWLLPAGLGALVGAAVGAAGTLGTQTALSRRGHALPPPQAAAHHRHVSGGGRRGSSPRAAATRRTSQRAPRVPPGERRKTPSRPRVHGASPPVRRLSPRRSPGRRRA
jgi:hypothetical protein